MTEASTSNERKLSYPDKLFWASQLAVLSGPLTNTFMTYQPNMSLGEAFIRYGVPTIGAAGVGAAIEISSRLKEKKFNCLESFRDVVQASTLRTAKFMGVSALTIASVSGLSYEAEEWGYNIRLERKAKAEQIAKLPKLSPATVVEEKTITIQKTAQQVACGLQKFGEVEYVSPIDGNQYSVSCVGNGMAP